MNISAYLPTQTYPNACKICKRHVLTLVNQPHPRSCFCMAPLPRKWAVPAWLPPLNQETWHIGEVSWNGATPESSIETHLNRIFHYRPSILWGTPIYGNPSWKADAMKYSEGFLQMFPSSTFWGAGVLGTYVQCILGIHAEKKVQHMITYGYIWNHFWRTCACRSRPDEEICV